MMHVSTIACTLSESSCCSLLLPYLVCCLDIAFSEVASEPMVRLFLVHVNFNTDTVLFSSFAI